MGEADPPEVAEPPAEPVPPRGTERRTGFMVGQITVPDDFDRLGEAEIAEMFYGEHQPLG